MAPSSILPDIHARSTEIPEWQEALEKRESSFKKFVQTVVRDIGDLWEEADITARGHSYPQRVLVGIDDRFVEDGAHLSDDEIDLAERRFLQAMMLGIRADRGHLFSYVDVSTGIIFSQVAHETWQMSAIPKQPQVELPEWETIPRRK